MQIPPLVTFSNTADGRGRCSRLVYISPWLPDKIRTWQRHTAFSNHRHFHSSHHRHSKTWLILQLLVYMNEWMNESLERSRKSALCLFCCHRARPGHRENMNVKLGGLGSIYDESSCVLVLFVRDGVMWRHGSDDCFFCDEQKAFLKKTRKVRTYIPTTAWYLWLYEYTARRTNKHEAQDQESNNPNETKSTVFWRERPIMIFYWDWKELNSQQQQHVVDFPNKKFP